MIAKTLVNKKREEGAALITTVMLLVLMAVIGLAAMETVTRDRQVAGFQNQNRTALYAAEAGLGQAKVVIGANFGLAEQLGVTTCLAPTPVGQGLAYAQYAGQPNFCDDPTVPPNTALECIGVFPLSPILGGGAGDTYEMWRVRMQGQTGGNNRIGRTRIDVVVGNSLYGGPDCSDD